MSISHALEQAQAAEQQGNWSLLNLCLQQLLLTEAPQEMSSPEIVQEVLQQEAVVEQVLTFALNVLEAGDFQDRWEVAKIFPSLGVRAIAPLIAILQDEEADPEWQWFVARILGEFHHPDIIPALVNLLQTSDSEDLSEVAAATLAKFGAEAIAPLTALLADPQARSLAAQALSRIQHPEAIAALLQVVDDPQGLVRAIAIEALSNFQDSRVPSILVAALGDSTAKVRQAAVTGLGFRADLLEDLNLVDQLRPLLLDLNLAVCQQAAIALGRLKTEAAAAALFEILQSPHTPTALQIDIIRALSWMQTPAATTALQQALATRAQGSTPSQVYLEIVTALGRVEQPDLKAQAAHTLIQLLQSNNPILQDTYVKQAVALELGQMGGSAALDSLIQLLAEPDAGVRLHAIAALKKLDPQSAYQQLKALSLQETLAPELRRGVAIALQEW